MYHKIGIGILRVTRFGLLIVLTVSTSLGAAENVTIRGAVYNDINKNGQRENDEPGPPNIQVSDGDQIARTDAEGRYTIETTTAIPNTVFVTNPNGYRLTTPFFHQVSLSDENANFGLAPDPAALNETFSFYHSADFQFDSPRNFTDQIAADLADMEAWANAHDVAFYTFCGDITTHGEVDDLAFFNEQFDQLERPVHRIFGGHDALVEMERPKMGNWVDAFGPYAYAWNYGGVHFISLVSEGYLAGKERSRQMRWMAADLEALPEDTPVIMLAHTPDQVSDELKSIIANNNVIAYLFGHWHTHHNYVVDSVPFFTSSPMRPSDWGAFTKRTRVMTYADGKLSSQSRVLEQKKRVQVLQPSGTVVVDGFDVRAMVYDTSTVPTVVRATITNNANAEAVLTLALHQENDWTWQGRVQDELKPGTYTVVIQADERADWGGSATVSVEESRPIGANMELEWVVSLGADQPHRTTPLLLDDHIYMAISDGQAGSTEAGVLCLDAATGTRVWRTELPRSINAAPCTDGESIFVIDGQGGVYALDRSDGQVLWRGDAYAGTTFHEELRYYWRTFLAPLTIQGDTLFAAGSHVLTGMSTKDGKKRWTNFKDLNRVPYPMSGLAPLGDRVYFADEHKLVALERETGAVAWRHALGDLPDTIKRERGTTTPLVTPGGIYFHHRSRVRKVDPDTGEQRWSAQTGGSMNYVGTPTLAGDRILVANDGQVICLDSTSGERQWAFGIHSASSTSLGENQSLRNGSSPLVIGDHVVVGGDDGYVYLLALADGTMEWEYNTGTPIKASPARSRNMVVITNFAGNIFGFRYR